MNSTSLPLPLLRGGIFLLCLLVLPSSAFAVSDYYTTTLIDDGHQIVTTAGSGGYYTIFHVNCDGSVTGQNVINVGVAGITIRDYTIHHVDGWFNDGTKDGAGYNARVNYIALDYQVTIDPGCSPPPPPPTDPCLALGGDSDGDGIADIHDPFPSDPGNFYGGSYDLCGDGSHYQYDFYSDLGDHQVLQIGTPTCGGIRIGIGGGVPFSKDDWLASFGCEAALADNNNTQLPFSAGTGGDTDQTQTNLPDVPDDPSDQNSNNNSGNDPDGNGNDYLADIVENTGSTVVDLNTANALLAYLGELTRAQTTQDIGLNNSLGNKIDGVGNKVDGLGSQIGADLDDLEGGLSSKLDEVIEAINDQADPPLSFDPNTDLPSANEYTSTYDPADLPGQDDISDLIDNMISSSNPLSAAIGNTGIQIISSNPCLSGTIAGQNVQVCFDQYATTFNFMGMVLVFTSIVYSYFILIGRG